MNVWKIYRVRERLGMWQGQGVICHFKIYLNEIYRDIIHVTVMDLKEGNSKVKDIIKIKKNKKLLAF